MKKRKMLKILKANNNGLTLIEIIVTIALLAIVSAFTAATYVNVMENQRMTSDISKLNEIDHSLEQIFIYKDAFNEAKEVVVNNNQINLTFPVSYNQETGKAVVRLEDAIINDSGSFKEEADVIYGHLVEFVGEEIQLDSGSYRSGKYCVYIEFDGTQVSSVRDYSITNDNTIITNSDDAYLYEMGN